METAEIFILLAVSVGFGLGLALGNYQCRKKFDIYVRKIFVDCTVTEMLEIRKETRKILGLRGK